jgi:hypothetical protein
MTTETAARPFTAGSSPRTCAIDAARHAGHLAHEARLLETIVADAAETGRYAASRAITRGHRELEKLSESAAHRVRRAPLLAVGAAFAAGILTAVLSAQCARALRMRSALQDW